MLVATAPASPLAGALALASAALRPAPASPSAGGGLRLDLPAIDVGAGGAAFPDAATLRVLAALYLYAEHEQAGLVQVVDVLADARATLGLRDEGTLGQLERYALRRDRFDRAQRTALYARLFGLAVGRGTAANDEFQRLLATFALAVVRLADAARWGGAGGTESAGASLAARALLGNLALHGFGAALLAAQPLHDQLVEAIRILSDAALQARLDAHGLWDLVHRVVGDPSPDFGRLTHRGRFGQQLLQWLATALPLLLARSGALPVIASTEPVALAAAGWLDATGLLPADATLGGGM